MEVPVYFCMDSVYMDLLLRRKWSSDYFQLVYMAFKWVMFRSIA